MNDEIVKKVFNKKFHGTILITDPCYIVPDDMKDKFFNLEYEHRLTYKGEDINQIRSLENIIENNQSWINFEKETNKDNYDRVSVNVFQEEINDNLFKINELKKEENYIDCKDTESPVIDFLTELGFTDCVAGYTLYGDWSCTVYSDGKLIGQFCADGGEYGIFYLDEVLKFNPAFDYHISKPWTSTVIKDFDGEIIIKIIETKFQHEWRECIDKSVVIEGKGNINFSTKQTGF